MSWLFKFLAVFFLFISLPSEAKEKICLNMIVKNESAVIKRCLDSVKPIIDYWIIIDTGSTDGTQEIIKTHMKGIPGELHERPWKNFGENRTEALQLAKGKGEYFLFMDADDWLDFDSTFQLPTLTKGLYQIWRVHGNDFSYLKAELARADLPWKWVGVLHEYLDCSGEPYEYSVLEGVKYVSGGDGARSHDPDKFLKHVKLLEDGLKKEPNNGRYVFYLAESYRDAGNRSKALQHYNKRIEMGGWEEETFWSMLQVAHLTRSLDLPLDIVIDKYESAHRFRPHRAEPLYFLAELYNQQGEYSLAYECIKRRDFIPKPAKKDILFNMDWIENHGLLYQLAMCSNFLGCYQEALDISNTLLSMKNVPDDWKQHIVSQQSLALEALATANAQQPSSEPLEEKTVLLAILARNKAHVLPTFLSCIDQLDYNKKLISLYISTSNNEDCTQEILEKWVIKNKSNYKQVIFENPTLNLTASNANELTERFDLSATIRNISLQKAKESKCDFYFSADCNAFIAPYTLKCLIKKDKPIIAPMLRGIPEPAEIQSTFFAEIDTNGYYQEHPNYWRILNREIMGTIKVPLIHQVYLIKTNYINKLSYSGNPNEWEFINFSRNARKNNVEQYICNEKDFGAFFRVSNSNYRLEDEVELFGHILAGELNVKFGLFPKSPLNARSSKSRDFLKGRLDYRDKRYCTFKLALQLMNERKVKTIVETGTARNGTSNFVGDGGSTILFADWASKNEGLLHSVDISKESILNAKEAVLPYKNHVKFTQSDSVHFLQTFPKKIDFLYLDSFDFDFSNPEPSQRHHLKEIEAAYDKLTPQSVIMIDDCKLPFGGKGKLVIEFLLKRGWEIVANDYQVILIKKSSLREHPSIQTMQLIKKNFEEERTAQEVYSQALVHQAANDLGKALSRFEKRTTLRGNPEETLWSWLKKAQVQEDLNKEPKEIIDSYNQAHLAFPLRIEPLYYLCCYYRKMGMFELAYETATKGLQVPSSPSAHSSNWIRDYSLLLEYSLCAWAVGNFEEAISATLKLLNHPQTSEHSKFILNRNVRYYRAGILIFHFAKEKWGSPPWEHSEEENTQPISCVA